MLYLRSINRSKKQHLFIRMNRIACHSPPPSFIRNWKRGFRLYCVTAPLSNWRKCWPQQVSADNIRDWEMCIWWREWRFESAELQQDQVCARFAHTAEYRKSYNTLFYNLDAIISVGYRVNSIRATQFRQWATYILRLFSIRGYVIDKKQMENESSHNFTS